MDVGPTRATLRTELQGRLAKLFSIETLSGYPEALRAISGGG